MGGESGLRPSVKPSLKHEKLCGYPQRTVAGVDEVGRGCLAGPVVAAAVILPPDVDLRKTKWLQRVTDSKMLDLEERVELEQLIRPFVLSWKIAEASVAEIETLNIFHASHLAMIRAVTGLNQVPQHVLVDGKFLPKQLGIPATPIIKGDLKSLSIACASILAKVYRDNLMLDLAKKYPGYGFETNVGYPTPAHKKALKELGITEIHRRTFAPVENVQPSLFSKNEI